MITNPAIIFIMGFVVGYCLGKVLFRYFNPLFGTMEISEKDNITDKYKLDITSQLDDIEKHNYIRLKIDNKRSKK